MSRTIVSKQRVPGSQSGRHSKTLSHKNKDWAQWFKPITLAFERLTQDYCYELQASLGVIQWVSMLDPYLKNPNQGQERQFSGQKNQIQFLAPTRQLTNICSSSLRGSRPSSELHRHQACILCTGIHTGKVFTTPPSK